MEINLEQDPITTITDPIETGHRYGGLLRFFLDVIETILLSIILFAAINAVSARIRVDGSSMEPTLHNNEFIIINKLAYKFGKPGIGDVIVFHFPRDPGQEYIKRVIGLPGDQVAVKDGRVYVNDQPLNENYIAAPPAYQNNWEVPANTLFVLGDNRNNSSDSHNWGPVPMSYVVGKAFFVYWPLETWGILTQVNPVSHP
jgi:signal peptidase I